MEIADANLIAFHEKKMREPELSKLFNLKSLITNQKLNFVNIF